MTPDRILIVEDEAHARLGLATTLIASGHPEPVACADLAGARRALARGGLGLVLLDLHLPDGDGEALLAEIAAGSPELPVIVVTAAQEVATAVRCMRLHAADYLVKPVDPPALEAAVGRTLAAAALERERRALAALSRGQGLDDAEAFAGLVTFDPGMIRLMRHAELVAPAGHPLLITGEPGSGKKALAAIIHRLGDGPGPLRVIDAAGVAEGSDLHGTGTLVVDHVEAMDRRGQAALLAGLRGGGEGPRLIATASADLVRLVQEGAFRADLQHLLERHRLHLPPLRERPGDVAALIHHLAPRLAGRRGLPPPPVADGFVRHCQLRPWPGNVAQLAEAIDAALTRDGRLEAPADGPPAAGQALPDPLPTLDQMRGLLVAEALRRSGGNLSEASRMLGITRWGLSKRLKQER